MIGKRITGKADKREVVYVVGETAALFVDIQKMVCIRGNDPLIEKRDPAKAFNIKYRPADATACPHLVTMWSPRARFPGAEH